MREQIPIGQVAGRTIEAVEHLDDALILTFTDGTFAYVEAYGNEEVPTEMYDLTIAKENCFSPMFFELLVQLDILSEAEWETTHYGDRARIGAYPDSVWVSLPPEPRKPGLS